MRRWIRPAAAVLAAALAAGCVVEKDGDGDGKSGGARGASAEARQDSAAEVQQALRDSGVTVDTQKIDTGTTTPAAPAPTPADDGN